MVKMKSFSDAKTFLEYFIEKKYLQEIDFNKCLFRGMGNSKLGLLARFFRKSELKDFELISKTTYVGEDLLDHPHMAILIESQIINEYYQKLNKIDYEFPESSYLLNSPFFSNDKNDKKSNNIISHLIAGSEWPPSNCLPIVALAQHYGLPTRMLDWTLNPKIACYFAAINGFRDLASEGIKISDNKIVVWIISKKVFEIAENELKYFECPYLSNRHLRAQEGVFTYNISDIKHLNNIDITEKYSEYLVKVELPIYESYDLLFELEKYDVSTASVFPTKEGIAKSILERLLNTKYNEIIEMLKKRAV